MWCSRKRCSVCSGRVLVSVRRGVLVSGPSADAGPQSASRAPVSFGTSRLH